MKKIFTIVAAILMTASVWAQAPEKMSYQAVVRDVSNNLTTNQGVGMQISILQGSATGTAVYVETQSPTTNANGLVSLEIGTGALVSGDFTTIDWANGTYFIKTETDPTTAGGTNYTITGTTQLMSVPYALHAKTADNFTGTITETDPVFGASIANSITAVDTANWNSHTVDTDTQLDSIAIATMGFITSNGNGSADSFYLGQDTLGGVVYFIYKDATGMQHGLLVNKNESTATWQSPSSLTNATLSWDGIYNTNLMVNSNAAIYVNGLTDGGFSDWYLPSIDELSFLWHNRYHVNKTLSTITGASLLSSTASYWSSTEISNSVAYYFRFKTGYADFSSTTYLHNNLYYYDKGSTLSVRAIRAF